MRKIIAIVAALLALSFVAGCGTLADATAARGKGMARTYDQPYDTVWDAVNDVLKGTDLKVASADKANGTILAQGAISAFSWGENVAIFVDRVDGKVSTRVEIVNKRAMAANVTAHSWDKTLFEKLDARLKPH